MNERRFPVRPEPPSVPACPFGSRKGFLEIEVFACRFKRQKPLPRRWRTEKEAAKLDPEGINAMIFSVLGFEPMAAEKSRVKGAVSARYLFFWFLSVHLELKSEACIRLVATQDRSTVSRALAWVEDLRAVYKDVAKVIQHLENLLGLPHLCYVKGERVQVKYLEPAPESYSLALLV